MVSSLIAPSAQCGGSFFGLSRRGSPSLRYSAGRNTHLTSTRPARNLRHRTTSDGAEKLSLNSIANTEQDAIRHRKLFNYDVADDRDGKTSYLIRPVIQALTEEVRILDATPFAGNSASLRSNSQPFARLLITHINHQHSGIHCPLWKND